MVSLVVKLSSLPAGLLFLPEGLLFLPAGSFLLPTSLIGPTARFGRKLGSCLPSYRHDMLGGPGPPMYIPYLSPTSTLE